MTKIDELNLNYFAIETRKRLGEDDSSPIDLFNLIKQIDGLTLVTIPFSDAISGMCIKIDENFSLISVNSNMTYGRKKFTLAHELYHFYYSINISDIICEKRLSNNDQEEIKANIFASYLLMPYNALKSFVKNQCNDKINIDTILKIENYFEISREALLVRLIKENYLTVSEAEKYKTNVKTIALIKGYTSKLYSISEDEKYYTSGAYIDMINKLKDKDAISNSKYEQLLLDAYRSDIVFGDDEIDVFD